MRDQDTPPTPDEVVHLANEAYYLATDHADPNPRPTDPQSVMYAELAVYGLSRLIPSPSDSPTAGPEDFDFLLETVEKIDADAVRQLLVQALLHLAASDFRASPVVFVALDLHRRGEES
jgi:hypothetical protein